METVPTAGTVSMGFFFDTGSALESPGHLGWSHLLEHMVFKGTTHRTGRQIALAIDRVGGDLNAYTDKEEISFYCTLPSRSWDLGLEILADLTQHPRFEEKELFREKSVILKEIRAIKDDPEDWIWEQFLHNLWPGHPYGRSVAGQPGDLRPVNLEALQCFFQQEIQKAPLTISLAGNFDPMKVVDKLKTLLLPREMDKNSLLTPPPGAFFRKSRKGAYQMNQYLWGLSFPGVPSFKDSLALQLLSLVFGESMGSRLFYEIREKKGLCYSITSLPGDFRLSKSFFISASTAPRSGQKLVEGVEREWAKLLKNGLSSQEFDHALSCYRGSLELQMENLEVRMNRNYQLTARYGRILSLSETLYELSSLTPEYLQESLITPWKEIPLSFLEVRCEN